MKQGRWLTLIALFAVLSASVADAQWLSVGGDRARTSTAPRGPHTLGDVRWQETAHADEEYVSQSSPAVDQLRVFVNARVFDGIMHDGNRLIAYAMDDGARLWAQDIPPDQRDSWSSPAIDERNGSVLLCSGDTIYAFAQASGAPLWQRQLGNLVNASPVVSTDLSTNGTPSNRVFITDFSIGSSGRLYAINVDPNDPIDNPYQPGQVVWHAEIGRASGATPAYADGKVYVASGAGNITAVLALDPPREPNEPSEAVPCWAVTIPVSNPSELSGFYGGIVASDGALFAATYNFVGGANSAELSKIDAANGDLIWQLASERTDSMPIVDAGGAVFLSGGVDGFGSRITLQAFEDRDPNAVPLWETADVGSLPNLGGWTHQPALAEGLLYVGSPDGGDPNAPPIDFGPYTSLYIVDPSVDPNDPAFIVDDFAGAGGTPAVAYRRLISIGVDGLFVFEPSPECAADINLDDVVDLTDLGTLLTAFGASLGETGYNTAADLDLNGTIDLADLGILLIAFGETCQ